jgi:hypothetical protein
MSAKYGVWPALLDPPVYYEHCRLALLVDGVINLWIRHKLDFDRRFLALRDRYSTLPEHTCHHHDQRHHCPLHQLPLFLPLKTIDRVDERLGAHAHRRSD